MSRLTPSERFAREADRALAMYKRLQRLERHLVLRCDRHVLAGLSKDLYWAQENLHVISQHLKGAKLDDGMGYWAGRVGDDLFKQVENSEFKRTRFLPKGVSIARQHRRELAAHAKATRKATRK